MCDSHNIVSVIKSRTLRWTGHVAKMEEGRSAFKILTGNPTGNRPLRRLGVDGKTILEWTSNRYAGNRIDLAQDRDYWRTLVNAALNFRVP